jgi:hypothetical protein
MIRNGISNCEVTTQYVRNADAIFGPNVVAMRGNTKKHTSFPSKPVLAPRVTQVQQTLDVDLMFIKQLVFIVGVLNPLKLTFIRYVKDRTAATLAEAIRSFIATAKSRNFDIQVIQVDGEGGVEKFRADIEKMGIQMFMWWSVRYRRSRNACVCTTTDSLS